MADDERKRALEAAHILNSAVFTDAIEAIHRRAVEMWRNGKTAQEREEAWYLQRSAALLHRELFNTIQCAAVNAGGKDELLNEEVSRAKEKANGRRSRSK